MQIGCILRISECDLYWNMHGLEFHMRVVDLVSKSC